MKSALRQIVRFFMMMAMCALTVACPDLKDNPVGLQSDFEVSLAQSEVGTAASRDINTDKTVSNVYAKVFNSSRVHLPSTDITKVTELTHDGTKWTSTVHLASPVSGTITFFVWAVNLSGEHLYRGTGNLTVETGDTSITVTTTAGYSLGQMGPAGGYFFYDKQAYSDGWRYLEAASSDIMLGTDDYYHMFGYYRTTENGASTLVGTATGIGSGEANTAALVSKMGTTAYTTDAPSMTMSTEYYAARLCDIHETGGCSDWFLPSKEELNLMYCNLKTYGLGSLSSDYYWALRRNTTTTHGTRTSTLVRS